MQACGRRGGEGVEDRYVGEMGGRKLEWFEIQVSVWFYCRVGEFIGAVIKFTPKKNL